MSTRIFPQIKLRTVLTDISAISLIISNLITIGIALYNHWSFYDVILVYWSQSVIIGVLNFVRMMKLRKFEAIKLTINSRSVKSGETTKNCASVFFLLHYGLFHLFYLLFILNFFSLFGSPDTKFIMINVLIFFINHLFSFWYNIKADARHVQDIGVIMEAPYARIIPMHIIIIFGVFLVGVNSIVLVVFLLLKTVADVIMHEMQHKKATNTRTSSHS